VVHTLAARCLVKIIELVQKSKRAGGPPTGHTGSMTGPPDGLEETDKMQSSTKWLVGAGLVVLVIIVASVMVAVLNRPQEAVLLPEGTPEGTVHRYLLAIRNGETRQAYEYLDADLQERCSFEHFRSNTQHFQRQGQGTDRSRDIRVALENVEAINGEVAVRVKITEFSVSAPFNVNEWSYTQEYMLEETDGQWRFVSEPWPMTWCPQPPRTP
jgi:hypothetical protein